MSEVALPGSEETVRFKAELTPKSAESAAAASPYILAEVDKTGRVPLSRGQRKAWHTYASHGSQAVRHSALT